MVIKLRVNNFSDQSDPVPAPEPSSSSSSSAPSGAPVASAPSSCCAPTPSVSMHNMYCDKKGCGPRFPPFACNPAPLPTDPLEVASAPSPDPEAALAYLTLARDADPGNAAFNGYPGITSQGQLDAIGAAATQCGSSKAFERLVATLVRPRPEVIAEAVRRSVKGLGTRDTDLIAALACAHPDDLAPAREAYARVHEGRSMVKDIKGDTSGRYEDVLVRLCETGRPSQPDMLCKVDPAAAESDAATLRSAGEGRLGTDEEAFMNTVLSRSQAHMKCVVQRYAPGSPIALCKAIREEMGGNLGCALAAAADPAYHLARAVHSAVDGAGTDDKRLAEVLSIARADVIAEARRLYPFVVHGHTLERDLESDESGAIRRALFMLLTSTVGDAIALRSRRAMHGMGTDVSTLIGVFTAPAVAKRDLADAEATYERAFGKPLSEAVKGEESGNIGRFLAALATPSHVLHAKAIKEAISGLGTDDTTLAEIVASRAGKEMSKIAAFYVKKYGKTLVDAIESDTSGHQENALVALVNGSRRPEPKGGAAAVPRDAAERIADDIYAAGEDRLGTDDGRFVTILTSCSVAELTAANAVYEEKHGKSIIEAIKRETSGGFEKTLVACADPVGATARRVRKALAGLGTDDDALIGIIASRDRPELRAVGLRYAQLFEGKDMMDDIRDDTGGKYEKALLAWVRG